MENIRCYQTTFIVLTPFLVCYNTWWGLSNAFKLQRKWLYWLTNTFIGIKFLGTVFDHVHLFTVFYWMLITGITFGRFDAKASLIPASLLTSPTQVTENDTETEWDVCRERWNEKLVNVPITHKHTYNGSSYMWSDCRKDKVLTKLRIMYAKKHVWWVGYPLTLLHWGGCEGLNPCPFPKLIKVAPLSIN